MQQINDRTEHSPQDPRWRVPENAPRTDYDRSGEGAEARRRAHPTVAAATINPTPDPVAILAYQGIPRTVAARIVQLESRVAELEMLFSSLAMFK